MTIDFLNNFSTFLYSFVALVVIVLLAYNKVETAFEMLKDSGEK
jgi:hypothetical protein